MSQTACLLVLLALSSYFHCAFFSVHSLLCIVNVGKVITPLRWPYQWVWQLSPWSLPSEPALAALLEDELHTP